jgi:orotate phosphoribosyltransferase
MKILQNPAWANEAARSIAGRVGDLGVGVTLSPAVGGIVWGWAVAQHLPGARAIFAERVDGVMTLRRTFELGAGERVLLTEDVITTGGSVLEVKALAEAAGATVVGVACVMDRSGGAFDPGVPVFAWGRMLVESWAAGECPLCAAGSTAVKPGSRAIKA